MGGGTGLGAALNVKHTYMRVCLAFGTFGASALAPTNPTSPCRHITICITAFGVALLAYTLDVVEWRLVGRRGGSLNAGAVHPCMRARRRRLLHARTHPPPASQALWRLAHTAIGLAIHLAVTTTVLPVTSRQLVTQTMAEALARLADAAEGTLASVLPREGRQRGRVGAGRGEGRGGLGAASERVRGMRRVGV